MAKIYTESIVITLSKLVRDSDVNAEIISDDTVSALQAVVEELTGAGIVVELERA